MTEPLRLATSLHRLVLPFLLFAIFFDLAVLDPTDIGWLIKGDLGAHFVGWTAFQHDAWRWPIGYSELIAYPTGMPLTATDSNPLMAVPLKLLSPLMPAYFQFIGIWYLLCLLLSYNIAFNLLNWLSGRPVPAALAAVVLITAPYFFLRLQHDTLMAQWLILASFSIFIRPNSDRRAIAKYAGVAGLSMAVHPYFLPMTFAVTGMDLARRAFRRYQRQQNVLAALRFLATGLAVVLAVTVLVTWLLGILNLETAGKHIGIFTMDPLAWFNGWGGPRRPHPGFARLLGRSLEDCAPRRLHRMVAAGPGEKPAVCDRQFQIPDPALGPDSKPRFAYPLRGAAPVAAGLVRPLQGSPGPDGDLRRDSALHWCRVQGLWMDPCWHDPRTRQVRQQKRMREAQKGYLALPTPQGLEANAQPLKLRWPATTVCSRHECLFQRRNSKNGSETAGKGGRISLKQSHHAFTERLHPVRVLRFFINHLNDNGFLFLTTPNFFARGNVERMSQLKNPQPVFSAAFSREEANQYHVREFAMYELIEFALEAGGRVSAFFYSDCWDTGPDEPPLSQRSNLCIVVSRQAEHSEPFKPSA